MRWIIKVMGQGLATLIPIAVTVWVVVWLGILVERILANPLKRLFPFESEIHSMAMGIGSFLVVLFVVGLLMRLWVVRAVFDMIGGWFKSLPLVKTLFGAVQDVTLFITGGRDGGARGDMVVTVEVGQGWRQLGIVTRQDFTDLPPVLSAGGKNVIAVYMPFSYQFGGFTYFIERERCTPVEGMSVEDAMRYSVMAWLGSSDKPRDAAAQVKKVAESDS